MQIAEANMQLTVLLLLSKVIRETREEIMEFSLSYYFVSRFPYLYDRVTLTAWTDFVQSAAPGASADWMHWKNTLLNLPLYSWFIFKPFDTASSKCCGRRSMKWLMRCDWLGNFFIEIRKKSLCLSTTKWLYQKKAI